jgi:hypothetical protein
VVVVHEAFTHRVCGCVLSSLVDRRLFGWLFAACWLVHPAVVGQERWWVVGGESDTLLGPEGSSSRVWFLGPCVLVNRQVVPVGVGLVGVGVGVWDRSYFENFTVDASIFVVTTSY